MTDYPNPRAGWRKRQIGRKWQTLVAVFITVVLLLALVNGLAKSVRLGQYLGQATWDSGLALVIALNTNPTSIAIFSPDQRKIVLLKLGSDLQYLSGDPTVGVAPIASLFEKEKGEVLGAKLSAIGGIPIRYYIKLDRDIAADGQNLETMFIDFASLTTPFKILAGGYKIGETNLTRNDLVRLWWQAKSLGVNDLKLIDANQYTLTIIGQNKERVTVVDSDAMRRAIALYLESRKIIEDNVAVAIRNQSGVSGMGQLAADMMGVLGAHVLEISANQAQIEKCQITTGDKKTTVYYLAKILDCDINEQVGIERDVIEVVIGRDFARKYQI